MYIGQEYEIHINAYEFGILKKKGRARCIYFRQSKYRDLVIRLNRSSEMGQNICCPLSTKYSYNLSIVLEGGGGDWSGVVLEGDGLDV